MLSQPEYLVLFVPHMLLALSAHEASHAYAAYLRGDDTAAMMGRVTLNPLKHLELFGLIAFAVIGLGWAKPVPVNPLRLRHPRRDNLLISFAGPGSNLVIGLVCLSLILFIYNVLGQRSGAGLDLIAFLLVGAQLNLALALFNLIPAPPLDGSHILLGLLPEGLAGRLEEVFAHGTLVLLGLILLASVVGRVGNFDVFYYIIGAPREAMIHAVLGGRVSLAAELALMHFLGPINP
jgi:Zn-dependent protease